MKFERPSRIQALTLPMVLTPPYHSMVAQVWRSLHSPPRQLHVLSCVKFWQVPKICDWLQAHNGSGKTTCFVLSMLSRVDPNIKQPQAS